MPTDQLITTGFGCGSCQFAINQTASDPLLWGVWEAAASLQGVWGEGLAGSNTLEAPS